MKTQRVDFGRYSLVAAPVGSRALARAFLKGARPGSGIVEEAKGSTPQAAIEALQAKLLARDAARLSERRPFPGYEELTVPRPDEYRDALLRISPTDAQWAMLRHHAAAGAEGATETELARAAGFSTYSAANLQYGLLGRLVADALAMRLPTYEAQPDREVATMALAEERKQRRDDQFVWIMHPELRQALSSLP